MTGGIHVENVEVLRAFMDRFDAICGDAQAEIRNHRLQMVEACAWVERCHDDARAQLSAAEQQSADCQRDLWACESSGDDDYEPDCSTEQGALDDARETEALWRMRVERIAQLSQMIADAKRAAERGLQNEARSIAEASAHARVGGQRYLSRIGNASAT